jgi:hypothetical protein
LGLAPPSAPIPLLFPNVALDPAGKLLVMYEDRLAVRFTREQ